MKKGILYIFIFIISILSVHAIDGSNLWAYYKFDQGNQSNIPDTSGLKNLTFIYGTGTCDKGGKSSAGLYGNATYYGTCANDAYILSSLNASTPDSLNFSKYTWSINTWYNISSSTGNQIFIEISNGTYNNDIKVWRSVSETLLYSNILPQTGNSSGVKCDTNKWCMVTLTYDGSVLRTYIDSVYVASATRTITNGMYDNLYLGATDNSMTYSYIDEVSIFNKTLSVSEIDDLYNDGLGLTFENISNATFNGTSEIINYSYFQIDGNYFSSSQCINVPYGYNTADYICNNTIYNENDNSFYCNIEDINTCQYGCIQKLYDNDSDVTYFYDSLKSCTTIKEFYLSGITLDCSSFWEYFLPNTHCYLNFETIPLSNCANTDNIEYLLNLTSGHTVFVEGQCNKAPIGVNECANSSIPPECMNSKQVKSCTLFPNGYYKWNITQTCIGTDVCKSGNCVPIVITPEHDLGTLDNNATAMWDKFLGISTNNPSGRLMIALIGIMIAGIVGALIIFSVKNASGYSLPSSINVAILTTFTFVAFIYFITIAFIPLWVLILLIIIIAIIIASIGRKAVLGGG